MIQEDVYAILSADDALAALVGDKIYPDVPTENTALPFLVYWITDSTSNPTLTSKSSLTRYTLQVECWATKLYEVAAIQAAVDNALDYYRGNNIKGSFAQATETTPEDTGYHGQQAFNVWYDTTTRSGPQVRGTGTVYSNNNGEFSHAVTLPTAVSGDTLVVLFRTTDTNPTASGWTRTSLGNDLWCIHKAYVNETDVTISLIADNPLKATAFSVIANITVDHSDSTTTTSTTTHDAPVVTSTTTSGIMFVCLSTQASNHTHTYPEGLTGASAGAGGNKLSTCYDEIIDAGSTGTRTFTTSISTSAQTGTILFKEE
jgi:hypothetical protein